MSWLAIVLFEDFIKIWCCSIHGQRRAHARGFALHQLRETAVDVQVRAANEESGDRRAFGRQACAEVDVCQG